MQGAECRSCSRNSPSPPQPQVHFQSWPEFSGKSLNHIVEWEQELYKSYKKVQLKTMDIHISDFSYFASFTVILTVGLAGVEVTTWTATKAIILLNIHILLTIVNFMM